MLLFRAEEHIDRWCSKWSQPRGGTLSIHQAWRLSQAWFHNKMDPDWHRATLEEAEAVFSEIGLTGPFWSLRP
ncbi:MAG TPA: hypothetical protein VEU96_04665 [Bryobacteraceae bacterium]|nr:hypothetical protein [Bryobacteraceae bacterium]